jgi:hypothetical protein
MEASLLHPADDHFDGRLGTEPSASDALEGRIADLHDRCQHAASSFGDPPNRPRAFGVPLRLERLGQSHV